MLVSVVLQPGISLAESNRIGRIAEADRRRGAGGALGRTPHGPRRARRACRGRPQQRARRRPAERPRAAAKRCSPTSARGCPCLPASITVGQPIAHRLDHMLSGVRAQIALKIYGDDYDTLRGLAADLEARLKAIPGVVDLQIEKQVRIPQLQVRVDYAKAALYGLNPARSPKRSRHCRTARVVSQIIDQSKRFDVVLRLSDADRSTRALGEMLIESPAGRIPLSTDRRRGRDRRTQSDPARERPPPYRRARQHRRLRHGAHRRRHPRGHRRNDTAAGLLRQPRGPVPGAGGGLAPDRPAVARVAAADLRRALHALPVGGAGARSSWATCRWR